MDVVDFSESISSSKSVISIIRVDILFIIANTLNFFSIFKAWVRILCAELKCKITHNYKTSLSKPQDGVSYFRHFNYSTNFWCINSIQCSRFQVDSLIALLIKNLMLWFHIKHKLTKTILELAIYLYKVSVTTILSFAVNLYTFSLPINKINYVFLEMYWRPLSVYLFFLCCSFGILIIRAVGGDSETIKVKNNL
jgi:hypothetical protein